MSQEQDAPNDNRRGAPRVDTPLFEGTMADHGSEIRCRISNLSRLGACAVSNVALPEMTRVKIRFTMDAPDQAARNISCEAAVVRCQKRADGMFEVGLFFTMMQAEDRSAIERLAAQGSHLSVR
jgi:hypothetical protein